MKRFHLKNKEGILISSKNAVLILGNQNGMVQMPSWIIKIWVIYLWQTCINVCFYLFCSGLVLLYKKFEREKNEIWIMTLAICIQYTKFSSICILTTFLTEFRMYFDLEIWVRIILIYFLLEIYLEIRAPNKKPMLFWWQIVYK